MTHLYNYLVFLLIGVFRFATKLFLKLSKTDPFISLPISFDSGANGAALGPIRFFHSWAIGPRLGLCSLRAMDTYIIRLTEQLFVSIPCNISSSKWQKLPYVSFGNAIEKFSNCTLLIKDFQVPMKICATVLLK